MSGLVRRLGPVRSRSVAGCGGRERKSALPLISRAILVLQGVGVGGDELQPTLDASVVLADFSDALEGLVIRVDVEFGGSEVVAEAFDGPNDAAGFEVKGGPGSFVVESGAAGKDDGTDEPSGCSYSRIAPNPSRGSLTLWLLILVLTSKSGRVTLKGASINYSINRPINQLISQSINQSTDRSINR